VPTRPSAARAARTHSLSARSKGSHCERLGDRYNTFFEACEWTSVAIFTVEYLLRIWACTEYAWVAKHGPFYGRLRYGLTFFPLIDLMSIAPNLLYLIPNLLHEETPDFTTSLRVVRLLRILKSDKYINAFGLLGKARRDWTVRATATMGTSALAATNPLAGAVRQPAAAGRDLLLRGALLGDLRGAALLHRGQQPQVRAACGTCRLQPRAAQCADVCALAGWATTSRAFCRRRSRRC